MSYLDLAEDPSHIETEASIPKWRTCSQVARAITCSMVYLPNPILA